MDKSFTCECGCSDFTWLFNKVRCKKCYSEYHKDSYGTIWMRRFNKEKHQYRENCEIVPHYREATLEEFGGEE